jgi:hypothetical protein
MDRVKVGAKLELCRVDASGAGHMQILVSTNRSSTVDLCRNALSQLPRPQAACVKLSDMIGEVLGMTTMDTSAVSYGGEFDFVGALVAVFWNEKSKKVRIFFMDPSLGTIFLQRSAPVPPPMVRERLLGAEKLSCWAVCAVGSARYDDDLNALDAAWGANTGALSSIGVDALAFRHLSCHLSELRDWVKTDAAKTVLTQEAARLRAVMLNQGWVMHGS